SRPASSSAPTAPPPPVTAAGTAVRKTLLTRRFMHRARRNRRLRSPGTRLGTRQRRPGMLQRNTPRELGTNTSGDARVPPTYRVNLTLRAADHLREIYDYIEQDSPQNAAHMIARLLDAIDALAHAPAPIQGALRRWASRRGSPIDARRQLPRPLPRQRQRDGRHKFCRSGTA